MALRATSYALGTLRSGFTTLRDVHAPGGIIIELARAIRARHVPGPTIHAGGTGLSVTGGHMDQPGWADHVRLEDVTSACDGPLEFRRGVRRQVKRGADLIKINACVSSLLHPDHLYRQEVTDEELFAACDEAHLGSSATSRPIPRAGRASPPPSAPGSTRSSTATGSIARRRI